MTTVSRVLMLLALSACSPHARAASAARTGADDVRGIRETYAAFAAADLAGDVERQLGLLTDDAVFMPRHSSPSRSNRARSPSLATSRTHAVPPSRARGASRTGA